MQQRYQKCIFIEIAINTDAVIFVGMCMAVIAQYAFPLAADSKMNFMVLEVKSHFLKTSGRQIRLQL